MSQKNSKVVRRGYEVLNKREIDAWLEGFHPGVEVHDLAGIPDAPVRSGHADLREWVAMIEGIWADARYEPEEFIEAGDRVVVAVRAKARGRGSDLPMDVPMFQVFEMQDGTVRRVWAYLDRDDALEAVGLSE